MSRETNVENTLIKQAEFMAKITGIDDLTMDQTDEYVLRMQGKFRDSSLHIHDEEVDLHDQHYFDRVLTDAQRVRFRAIHKQTVEFRTIKP